MQTKSVPPSQYAPSSEQDGQAPGSGTVEKSAVGCVANAEATGDSTIRLDVVKATEGTAVKDDANLGMAISSKRDLVMVGGGLMSKL